MIQKTFKRYEKKYLLSPQQYRMVRQGIQERMQLDQYGLYTICSIYFDTDNFQLIRSSLEKPVYKEKLRLRSYGVPEDAQSPVFLELKKKYKGVVYKRRVDMQLDECREYLFAGERPHCDGQILHEIDWFQHLWHTSPKVFLAYDRMAFFSPEEEELRITFDQNIRWRDTQLSLSDGDWGYPLLQDALADHVLMEIKIPGAMPLWLSCLLDEAAVFPTSFSKYGYCYKNYLFPDLEKNTPLEANFMLNTFFSSIITSTVS